MEQKINVAGSIALAFLNYKTPIEAKLSDHNIVISNGILTFNMMMRCQYNVSKKRYNNGFGIEETQAEYRARLEASAAALAEVLARNPHIYAISLEEAPIEDNIEVFIKACGKHPSLAPFMESMNPSVFTKMGVATFFNSEHFISSQQDSATCLSELGLPDVYLESLDSRVQFFELRFMHNPAIEFTFVNAHLPFDLAKGPKQFVLIDLVKNMMRSRKPHIVTGDFNLDPELLISEECSAYVPPGNNVLLKAAGTAVDKVDGILFSAATGLKAIRPVYRQAGSCATVLLKEAALASKAEETLALYK